MLFLEILLDVFLGTSSSVCIDCSLSPEGISHHTELLCWSGSSASGADVSELLLFCATGVVVSLSQSGISSILIDIHEILSRDSLFHSVVVSMFSSSVFDDTLCVDSDVPADVTVPVSKSGERMSFVSSDRREGASEPLSQSGISSCSWVVYSALFLLSPSIICSQDVTQVRDEGATSDSVVSELVALISVVAVSGDVFVRSSPSQSQSGISALTADSEAAEIDLLVDSVVFV